VRLYQIAQSGRCPETPKEPVMKTDKELELERQATVLLRDQGYTWSGRQKAEAHKAQSQDAMNGAIRCPFSGKSRRK